MSVRIVTDMTVVTDPETDPRVLTIRATVQEGHFSGDWFIKEGGERYAEVSFNLDSETEQIFDTATV